jgi:hypothetical protein
MKIRVLAGFAIGVLSVGLLAAPASAATDRGDEGKAQYLEQLEASAGNPSKYTPTAPVGGDSVRTLAIEPDYFNCTLFPSQVHLRKSGNFSVAGAKPYTECVAGTPSSISQTSTLYIVEWGGLAYKQMASMSAGNYNSRRLEQKNINYTCINGNTSLFQQETSGISVQNGRSFRSSVTTIRSSLPCGY